AAEQPPTTRDQALVRWRRARGQFLAALERSRDWQRRLAALEDDLARLPGLIDAERAAVRRLATATEAESALRECVSKGQAAVEVGADACAKASAAVDEHVLTRP